MNRRYQSVTFLRTFQTVSAKNKVGSRALKTDELASPIDLRADETRVTHDLIYRITNSRNHSSDLSGGLKVSKEIFPFPPDRAEEFIRKTFPST